MTVSERPNTETPSGKPSWPAIFHAMHALRSAGVTSEAAYRVLKVEALAVSTDESGDVIIPNARRPRPGANQSGPISSSKAAGGSTQN